MLESTQEYTGMTATKDLHADNMHANFPQGAVALDWQEHCGRKDDI